MSTVDIEAYNANEEIRTENAVRTSAQSEAHVPYLIHELSNVPSFSPYGGQKIVRFTGSTHDEQGFLTKDPAKVQRLNERLAAKIEEHLQEIEQVSTDLEQGARTLLLGYGITARSILESTHLLRAKGKKVSRLIIHSIWPVPEDAIIKTLQGIERVVVPELNLGQYRREVERITGRISHSIEVIGINRVDGEMISPNQIIEVVK